VCLVGAVSRGRPVPVPPGRGYSGEVEYGSAIGGSERSRHGLGTAVLAFLRTPRMAWAILVAAPLPIAVALIFTARPVYPPDACFYGAPAASVAATDHYLALMSPLAAFAMVAVALAALPIRGRWRVLAPATAIWAIVTLFAPGVAHPVMVYGGNVAVFGALLALVVLVLFAVIAKESSWIRAIGWFEFALLLPLLLGVAGLIAQPGCYSGDPPAPIPQ
jgi:hypothetical protein